MKKFTLILVSLVMLGMTGLFAEEDFETFQFGITGCFPMGYAREDVADITTKNTIQSWGLGLQSLILYGDNMGGYGDFEVFFPYRVENSIYRPAGYVSGNTRQTRDNFSRLWGISEFTGISYYIVNNDDRTVTVSPGVSETFIFSQQEKSATDVYIGVGVNLMTSYNLTEYLYLSYGAKAVYEFWNASYNGDLTSSHINRFLFDPFIGFGYKIDNRIPLISYSEDFDD